MPETPETPEEPQQGPPPIEEGPKQRPTGAESTPGGVGAPLGTETYETRALPALDALLQTTFMEVLPSVKGLKDLQPHAESHEPFGDDRVLAFGPLYLHDRQYEEYTEAGMADADGNTVLGTIGVVNAELGFGWSLARNVTDRAGALIDHFNSNLWDPVFMGIVKSHTGTPAVQPDMDNSNVSRLELKTHDIIELRRLEFTDTDQAAGNNISLQQRGDAAGAILEVVNDNDATQYSSPTYRRLRLADPVGADDAATKRYVDALSYAGHTLLDASLHTDTLAAGVTDGSIVIGNVTPKWSELVISIPAANVRNVLGVDNGELRPSWKTALDATNPVNAGGAAAPGTSLVFSHRDHVHAVASSHSGSAHHALVSLAADAQELLNLSTQELGFVVKAANLIFAGPAAGGAADPTFRSLVDADIPAAIARDAELHDILTIGADAAHSLAAQVLSAEFATSGQTGHMSGAMFDKLGGIEAAADVTDAANVAGAGAVMDSDFAPGEGFLRKTGAGTYTAHKSNLAAAAAPDADEDSADGYSVGSLWIDTTNDNMYVCVDATEAAAVWLHLNAAAAAHDHTGAADGGVLTNDEHDGYSEFVEIAAPGAGAANKLRLYVKDIGGASLPLFQNSEGIETTLVGIGRPQRTTFWSYDDFMGRTEEGHTGILRTYVTGAGAVWGMIAAEASHQGIWHCDTGTTATGHSRLISATDGIIFSNGRIRLGVWVKTLTNLSTAAQRYQVYAGIFDTSDPITFTDGIEIRYRDDIVAGNWQGVVVAGGGRSTLDLGIAVAANTWYFLEMEINAAGNSVEFFIDGTSAGTVASGPAANATAEVRIGLLKTVGTTNRRVYWDAYYLYGEMAAAR